MPAWLRDVRDFLRVAIGPAFRHEPRDLTPEGLTKPGHVLDIGDVGPGRVVVLIPAHNEEGLIGAALESLAAQTRIPDEVLVITDNCTDLTAQVASAHGVASRTTILNRDAKAGALNQVLAELLLRLTDNDAVLVMDADTQLSARFISEAAWRLREQDGQPSRVGAVGGIFLGYPVRGLLALIQDNEYVRYARDIGRRKGRADVLTGTGTLFSVRALREVEHARSLGVLPPATGIYGIDALTEDNELTLAFKCLGYRCVSPKDCISGTEMMPTLSRLSYQRLRWQRGALENLRVYGLTRHTFPYIAKQVMTYVAVAFLPFFLTAMVYARIETGTIGWSWFWIYVTAFVVFERVWSVKRGGWKSVALAALVLPEALYDLYLHGVYLKALTDILTGAQATWDRTETAGSASRHSTPQLRKRIAGPVYSALMLACIVGMGVACAALSLAWTMIAVVVLVGAMFAALRLSGLDPFSFAIGSGEVITARHAVAPPERSGFGGPAVPVDGSAIPGGQGRHHWLGGGVGRRNQRATFSREARRARQAMGAWLAASREADRQVLAAGGGLLGGGTGPGASRVTFSAEAQRARDSMQAWLAASREAETQVLAAGGGPLGGGTEPGASRVTFSAEAQRARDSMQAWLISSRQAELNSGALAWKHDRNRRS
jgi:glycosyltransferase involved in cell wall biosynthesis